MTRREGGSQNEEAGDDVRRLGRVAEGSIEECRYYLILVKDLEYGDVSEMSRLLEEVSKLLEAYSHSILDSDF